MWGDATILQCRHNGRDGVSNHQPHHCLLNRLFRRRSKKNIKAPRHWPFRGEFTNDRWIPSTKDQWRGKCFHLITSSCLSIRSISIPEDVKQKIIGLLSKKMHFDNNSLASEACGCRPNLKFVIFKLMSRINILRISCEIFLKWISKELTDDKSTLLQWHIVKRLEPSSNKPLP